MHMQKQAGDELSFDVKVAVDNNWVSGGYFGVLDDTIYYDGSHGAQSRPFERSSTAEDTLVNTVQSESTMDLEPKAFMERVDELEGHYTGGNSTKPALTSTTPGGGASLQPPPTVPPSISSDATPIIRSEHQFYTCSWHTRDSDVRCDYTARDRRAFLRHLGAAHHVSGDPRETIICGLLDSKTGSACRSPVKRASFPRHADTHYPLRYHCQHCPIGMSFSRQDSWKKHMRNKHP